MENNYIDNVDLEKRNKDLEEAAKTWKDFEEYINDNKQINSGNKSQDNSLFVRDIDGNIILRIICMNANEFNRNALNRKLSKECNKYKRKYRRR